MKIDHRQVPALISLVIFGVGFGYVEAAVVRYLHLVLGWGSAQAPGPYRTILNLGFMAFVQSLHPALISATISQIEAFRETATIVMLAALAFVASRHPWRRLGAFMIAFAIWDLSYYLFLMVLIGWPTSLSSMDIYFLIPFVWVGPVITPVVISTALLITGCWLFTKPLAKPRLSTKLT